MWVQLFSADLGWAELRDAEVGAWIDEAQRRRQRARRLSAQMDAIEQQRRLTERCQVPQGSWQGLQQMLDAPDPTINSLLHAARLCLEPPSAGVLACLTRLSAESAEESARLVARPSVAPAARMVSNNVKVNTLTGDRRRVVRFRREAPSADAAASATDTSPWGGLQRSLLAKAADWLDVLERVESMALVCRGWHLTVCKAWALGGRAQRVWQSTFLFSQPTAASLVAVKQALRLRAARELQLGAVRVQAICTAYDMHVLNRVAQLLGRFLPHVERLEVGSLVWMETASPPFWALPTELQLPRCELVADAAHAAHGEAKVRSRALYV